MEISMGSELMIITPGRVTSATVTYIDENNIILGSGMVIIRQAVNVPGRRITLMENGRDLLPSEILTQFDES